MARFQKGEKVICVKFGIETQIVTNKDGIRIENIINVHHFNREAIIVGSWKELLLEKFPDEDSEFIVDREEYEIQFTDDATTLAWVKGEDLVKKEVYGVYPNKNQEVQ